MGDDKVHVDNEEGARQAIEGWRQLPLRAQLLQLQGCCESLELSQMYYEQKGNDKGVERMEQCLVILRGRRREIEEELGG